MDNTERDRDRASESFKETMSKTLTLSAGGISATIEGSMRRIPVSIASVTSGRNLMEAHGSQQRH